ncbi:MAG TPA: hypothetical protein VIT83_07035 [Gammaproteobacteria bacterium]
MNISQTAARWGAFFFAFMCISLASWPVLATHERDHRYTVEGYVLDTQQQPRPGISVSVSKDNRTLGQAITDSRGFFSIQAHLHDPDIGSTLEVRAGNSRGEIRMQATRGDQRTRRIHHVNLVGDQLVEAKLDVGFPPWMYAAGGAAAILLVAGIAVGRKKKKRKAAVVQQKTESKKRKKRNKSGKKNK